MPIGFQDAAFAPFTFSIMQLLQKVPATPKTAG